MGKSVRRLCGAALVVALFTVAGAAQADTVNGNLPGGTSITVGLSSPANGAVVPQGATVPIAGTASVGTGIPIKDTTVVFVYDRSGSMTINAGVDCTGDGANDTRAICVREAVIAGNNAAAAAGSAVDLSGFASFASDQTAHDVNLGAAGTQLLVAPAFDGNGNGKPDVNDVAAAVAAGVVIGPGTCYGCGLTAVQSILSSPLNTNAKNLVLFLSDGLNAGGTSVSSFAGAFGSNTIFRSIALGVGTACTGGSGGSLQDIANLTSGGSCTQTNDFDAAADLITQALGSTLSSIAVTVDGLPVASTVAPALPQNGPASVAFSSPSLIAPAVGSHTVCATASGADGGGAGSVGPHCHTFTVNAAPTVDAGDAAGVEGSAIPIAGSVVDADSTPTLAWTYAPLAGVDPGATCAFADASLGATSITCTDDGTYTLTLTAADGVNAAVSDSAVLTVANAAPVLTLSSPAAGLHQISEVLTAAGTFTDAGSNDTHTCSVAWGDAATTACGATHTYASGGTYTIAMTVTDDDGASDVESVVVLINTPPSCSGLSSNIGELWSPNGKLVEVTLAGATDADGNTLTTTITGVTQDEIVAGPGNNRNPDAVAGSAANKVQLRAERFGTGDGRVYAISTTVTDGFGGSCSKTIKVSVPHSQNGTPAVDSGQLYNSFVP